LLLIFHAIEMVDRPQPYTHWRPWRQARSCNRARIRRGTGNGSIDLSILAADGSTYAPITNVNFALASQVANGSRIYDLSGGTYSFQVVGTVSGAYASIAPAQA
jgi:hypothetical protein